MGVDFKLQAAARPHGQKPRMGGEGIQHAHGVCEAEAARAAAFRHLQHQSQEVRVGPAAVLAAHAHRKAHVQRGAGHGLDTPQHPGPVAPDLAGDLLVGDGNGQVHRGDARAARGGQIRLVHAAPHDGPRRKAQGRDGADIVHLVRAHGRDAHFHLRHARGVQRTGYGQAFVEREGHARRLLAVAQGSVVDDDLTGLTDFMDRRGGPGG